MIVGVDERGDVAVVEDQAVVVERVGRMRRFGDPVLSPENLNRQQASGGAKEVAIRYVLTRRFQGSGN